MDRDCRPVVLQDSWDKFSPVMAVLDEDGLAVLCGSGWPVNTVAQAALESILDAHAFNTLSLGVVRLRLEGYSDLLLDRVEERDNMLVLQPVWRGVSPPSRQDDGDVVVRVDGSVVEPGMCVEPDHSVQRFSLQIRSMSKVDLEVLREYLQRRYEVVELVAGPRKLVVK